MPEICALLPGPDVAAFSPFSNPLSDVQGSGAENYSECVYQFNNKGVYGSIKIYLGKFSSREDVKTIQDANAEDHRNFFGRDPEQIRGVGDSAFFGYNAGDETLCDECGLDIIWGIYHITISLKGQYEDVSRDQKKQAAIRLARMLLDRLPQLIRS